MVALTAALSLLAASGDEPPIHIWLKIPQRGPVGVRMRVQRAGWPEDMQLSFMHLPDTHLQALTPRPRIPRGSGPFELSYTVAIPNVESTPEGPALQGAFDTPRGRHLRLNALIPVFQPANDPELFLNLGPALIEIKSELPTTSSLYGVRSTCFAKDTDELYNAVVLAGEAAYVQGSNGLAFASLDFDADALGRLAALEKRAAPELGKALGARSPLSLVIVHREPDHVPYDHVLGVNLGTTIAMFSKGVPDGRASSHSGTVLLHELIHSYLPPDDGLPGWMTEGFTEYFAYRWSLSLDHLPDPLLYGRLDGMWRVYDEARRTRNDDKVVGDYYGGAILAFCIDTRLRKDGSTLEKVLARTRRRARGKVENALWEQEIALASAPAGALVLNAKTYPVDPVEGCFEEAHLEKHTESRRVTDDYAMEHLGLIRTEERDFDLYVSESAGVFFPGDAIVRVEDTRITDLDDLEEALYLAVASGAPKTTFEVSRKGKLQKLEVALPAFAKEEGRGEGRWRWQKSVK